jgi:hypothetical protein
MDDDGWEDVTDPNELRKVLGVKGAQAVMSPGQGGAVPLTPQALRDVRIEALDKIALARKMREKSKSGPFATGFLAPTMKKVGDVFGGTDAKGVSADVETLGAAGALKKILDMAAANGGKNPLTPMSEGDVKVIGNSVQNLDIGQPDEDFQRNATLVEDAWTRAFQGASDNNQNLEQGLKWRAGEIAKLARGKPAVRPNQSGAGQVIRYDANGNRIR